MLGSAVSDVVVLDPGTDDREPLGETFADPGHLSEPVVPPSSRGCLQSATAVPLATRGATHRPQRFERRLASGVPRPTSDRQNGSVRELVVLGTASQTPTRYRNHNGYLLHWDTDGILFDPGEGTQRQLIVAGVSPWTFSRICITHLHGDHCLGLPGVVQRLSLDRVTHTIEILYPSSGQVYIDRLLHAAVFDERVDVHQRPLAGSCVVDPGPPFELVAKRLDHLPDTLGWRLEEPVGRTMLPDRLQAAGKAPLVAIVACMRKLLTILNAMARDAKAWSPQLAAAGASK